MVEHSLHPETWLEEHGDNLFRYAMVRVRKKEMAEEIVQETLLGEQSLSFRARMVLALVVVTTAMFSSPTFSAESKRARGKRYERMLPGWRTNTAQRSVELHELKAGGPGRDGIPAILHPRFVKPPEAGGWLNPDEPVIALQLNGESKGYPLQILIWHEIINDTIGGVPVAVTFCPLCYSADVFDRRIDGKVLTFGVSGFLRVSNMIMYDRRTESLWQQALGEAIVGELTGSILKRLPAQIISFEQFHKAYPAGKVLSHSTGFRRPYGRNPYVGYDSISQSPLRMGRSHTKGLLPREQLVTLSLAGADKAYPYTVTRKFGAINDEVGGVPLVVFHAGGAVSAVDREQIAASREVGSTGVFRRRVGEMMLRFRYAEGRFRDDQTKSIWDITGKAVEGPMEGTQLSPIPHGDYFAFSWLVFKPQTEIFKPPRRGG